MGDSLDPGLMHFIFILIVYADGRVCISILHAPGDDPMGYESSAERWSPVQSVEKILLSVVSMLAGKYHSSFSSLHQADPFLILHLIPGADFTKI